MDAVLLDDRAQDAQEQVILPYEYKPRHYQLGLWQAGFPHMFGLRRNPAKRFVLVWHRRAGKDKTTINFVTTKAMETVGNYLYMLPEQTQAKKVIWRGIDGGGFRFLDHIPESIVRRKYESDMLIELINGSTIQLGGSDKYDSWMGTNPRGIVFSEFSLQDPRAWDYFRPILVENNGWAVFIYTPRGHNHGYELFKTAQARAEEGDEDWYFSLVTVDDSRRDDGSPVITKADIEAEIAAGMPPEIVQQEFYCSFDAGVMGAYYADLIMDLRKREQIGMFPYDPSKPVVTAWDIGIHDATAIWFAQPYPGGPRIIEYYEERNLPLTEHIRFVQDKPYQYIEHIAPHDIEVRELVTGKTRRELALELGIDFTVNPKLSRDDGIEAVRALLPRCTFDEGGCDYGLEALMAYERTWDDRLKRFRDTPLHNWASHGADAFRMLAVGWTDDIGYISPRKPRVLRSF